MIDLVITVGAQHLLFNPQTTLETITTENHHEAQRATSERTMTPDGQVVIPLDTAAIRERELGSLNIEVWIDNTFEVAQ